MSTVEEPNVFSWARVHPSTLLTPPCARRPVRKKRPVAEKLPGNAALITGQRVIDVMFPYV